MGIRCALMIFLAAAFISSTLVWLEVRSGMNGVVNAYCSFEPVETRRCVMLRSWSWYTARQWFHCGLSHGNMSCKPKFCARKVF